MSRERHMKKVLSCQVASKSCGYSDKPPGPVSMPSATTVAHKHADAENHPPTPHSVLPEEPPAPVSMFSASIAAHKHADGENHPPTPHSVLEVAATDRGITTVSTSTLENLWKKAEHLVQSSGGILKVPWSSDKKARLVMSSSS